jgi:sigma-B regulation protein RsbU (phosphoserine phosphatase)
MLSAEKFNHFLRDVEALGRGALRGENPLTSQAEVILSAFVRHTGAAGGAVYMHRDTPAGYQLVVKSDLITAPDTFDGPVPLDVVDRSIDDSAVILCPLSAAMTPHADTLVPIRQSKEHFGLIALARHREEGVPDLELLRAASNYVGALISNQRMATEVKEGEFQLKYRLWELESLYDIGLSIASTLNLEQLSDEILIRTLSLLNTRSAALFLRRDKRFFLHRAFGEVRNEFLDDEINADQSARIAAGEVLQFDSGADCIFPGCHSLIAIPIQSERGVIGVLAAADRELREGGIGPFTQNDVRLLSQFGTQVAIALENSRLHREALSKQEMQRELEVAATIQRDILPRSLPQIPGFELATISRPARQLGGDYHAFFERDGVLSICVADVAGKSVPAAILVSAFHAAIQLLMDEGRDLGEIATELNRHIHKWSAENKFITLVLASIDREAGIVRYVNAGHNPPYLVFDGKAHALQSHGLPIGLMARSRYSVQTARFPAGALLAVYSDGISEAENPDDDEFGSERLQQMLVDHDAAPCPAIAERIAQAVEDFAAGLSQKDDQTMILVRTQA